MVLHMQASKHKLGSVMPFTCPKNAVASAFLVGCWSLRAWDEPKLVVETQEPG